MSMPVETADPSRKSREPEVVLEKITKLSVAEDRTNISNIENARLRKAQLEKRREEIAVHRMDVEGGAPLESKRDPVSRELDKQVGLVMMMMMMMMMMMRARYMHARRLKGDIVLLGTNALEKLGVKLVIDPKKDRTPKGSVGQEPVGAAPTSAVVAERKCVLPGLVGSGVCSISEEGNSEVLVLNNSEEPMIFRKGDVIGEWSQSEWSSENPRLANIRKSPKQLIMSKDVGHPLHVLFECQENALAKPPGEYNGYQLTVWRREDMPERDKLLEMAKRTQEVTAEALAVALLYFRENCLHFQISEENLDPEDFFHENISVGSVNQKMGAIYQKAMKAIQGRRW
ncbi:unnamed protein product [Nippostrongylus brasiliensis]|uniref:Gag-pol polyprotein n=1 Tax=Nippostrongylus brasiliensis TaxID=27835 RepID=A0A158QYJ4_NIPBR|nr:unnamed protein product [Nippostrongylus brasiliensis]